MQALSGRAQVTQCNALLMWGLIRGLGLPTSTNDQTNETMTEQGDFWSQWNVDLSAAVQRDRGGFSCKGVDVQTDL